jgi:hypothetical protein
VLEKLKSAIDKTVKQFHDCPLDFLSERDIQSLLFAELRHELSNLRYRFEVRDVKDRFGYIPAINPVKTEYQLNPEGCGPRVDIAVLSEEQNPDLNIWRQPCRLAIEIKLWQPGGPYLDPWDDVQKLKTYWPERKSDAPFAGIAMLFVHPFADKWQKGLPDIEKRLEMTAGISPGPVFQSDGIALHLVTPSDWKQFSISSASAVSTLIGESQKSCETASLAISPASPEEALLGH